MTVGSREIQYLDPGRAYVTPSMELAHNLCSPLLDFRPGEALLDPDAAADLPEVSADGLTYTFKLKGNVTFADGSTLTAANFVRAFERAQLGRGPASLVNDYVQSVEALDDLTVRYTLKAAVPFFNILTTVDAYYPVNLDVFPADKLFIPPHRTSELANAYALPQKDADVTKMLGSGAYRLESAEYFDNADPAKVLLSRLVLVANPNYHGARPAASTVVLRVFTKPTAAESEADLLAALQGGEIDLIRTLRLPSSIDAVAADPNLEIVQAGSQYRWLSLNTTDCVDNLDESSNPVVACPLAVRQAVAAAIDRSTLLAQAYGGRAAAAYSPIPPGLWSHVESFRTEYGERNLTKARELLTSAGFSETNKLKLSLYYDAEYPAQDQALKAAIEETGLVEVTVVTETARAEGTGARVRTWYADYPDPDNFLVTGTFVGPTSYTKYTGAELVDLIGQARVEQDRAARQAKYEQVQQKWAQEVPGVPLAHRLEYIAMRKGIRATVNPDGHLLYKQITFE